MCGLNAPVTMQKYFDVSMIWINHNTCGCSSSGKYDDKMESALMSAERHFLWTTVKPCELEVSDSHRCAIVCRQFWETALERTSEDFSFPVEGIPSV